MNSNEQKQEDQLWKYEQNPIIYAGNELTLLPVNLYIYKFIAEQICK